MSEAANELLAEHGDRYDFIGFFTNVDPAIYFGAALYGPLFNDVSGIGDPSREGSPQCSSIYHGNVRTLSSADILAATGPRTLGASSTPKHFRMAWIMIHRPGTPPTPGEVQRAIDILSQNQLD